MGRKLGIGTIIICAFLIGFVIDFFMPYSQKFIDSGVNMLQTKFYHSHARRLTVLLAGDELRKLN